MQHTAHASRQFLPVCTHKDICHSSKSNPLLSHHPSKVSNGLMLIQRRHEQDNRLKCENFCLLSSSLYLASPPPPLILMFTFITGRWKEMSIYHLPFLPQHYACVVPPRTDPWNILLDGQSDATTELCHYNTCATPTACSRSVRICLTLLNNTSTAHYTHFNRE